MKTNEVGEGFFESIVHVLIGFFEGPKRWRRQPLRRVSVWAAALIVLFLAGFVIWLLLPMREVPPAELFPQAPFAFFSFNMDQDSPAMAELLSKERERIAGPGHGFGKKLLVKLALPKVLPGSIVGVIAIDRTTQEPELLIFMSMGKLVRVLKLYSRPLDKALFHGGPVVKERVKGHRVRGARNRESSIKPSAYTIVGNTIVIGSSLAAVKDSCESSRGNRRLDPSGLYLNALFIQSLAERDAVLYVDNGRGGMTKLIEEVSEKYSFAAFPAIDAVASIMGRVHLLTEELGGSAIFYCRGSDRLEEVKSDVKFLYGALRRMARASDMNLKGGVLVKGNTVRFEFQIPDFIGALFPPSTTEGGEKE